MTNITETAVQATTEQVEVVAEPVVTAVVPEKYVGKTIEDVIQMHQAAEKLIGKKVTEMPEDVVKQFLNVPKAPEQYLINEELDAKLADNLKKVGVEKNISQEQMKALSDNLIELNRISKEAKQAETQKYVEAEQAKLKEKFGAALEGRIEGIKTLLNQYSDENTTNLIKDAGLLHNSDFVQFLDKITQDVLRHTMVGSDFANRELTPSEAMAKHNEKLLDTEFRNAYYSARHPQHAHAVAEMEKLRSIMYSNGQG